MATNNETDLGSVKVDESITSAGRLDKMLKSDSPLMKRAETKGKQYANSRGLLNSSMAAGASQGAMIDAATPIAQQDSNNLMRGALSTQQFGQEKDLSRQGYEQQKGLTSQQSELEQEMVDTKAHANMRGQYLDSFTSMVNEANINISEIQSNSDIPAAEKEKMIDQQMQMRDADLKAMKSLFENMPMWEQNWNAL